MKETTVPWNCPNALMRKGGPPHIRAGDLSATGLVVNIIAVDQGHGDLRENTAFCAQSLAGPLHMVGIANIN